MKISDVVNLDFCNFVIAVVALLVAIYSICYAKACNKRKLFIQNGAIAKEAGGKYIVTFELVNMSPTPITLKDISFFDVNGSLMTPLIGYEPKQTYTEMGNGLYTMEVPDFIPDNMYADMLNGDRVLNPHSTESFGYYFDRHMSFVTIKVTCAERVYLFKKHQSFLTHLSDVED